MRALPVHLSLIHICAIVETAEMYGMITATHAHGTNGIKTAARAGVTSVEHGMMLDEECIEIMKAKGTTLVPVSYTHLRAESPTS